MVTEANIASCSVASCNKINLTAPYFDYLSRNIKMFLCFFILEMLQITILPLNLLPLCEYPRSGLHAEYCIISLELFPPILIVYNTKLSKNPVHQLMKCMCTK